MKTRWYASTQVCINCTFTAHQKLTPKCRSQFSAMTQVCDFYTSIGNVWYIN